MHAIAHDASCLKTLHKVAFKHTSAHQDSLYLMIVLSEVASRKQQVRCLWEELGEVFCPGPVLPNVQGSQARTRGSPFALVNGATAQDVLCVYVPDGVILDKPIHVVYIPTGKSHAHADPKHDLSRIGTASERWSMAP